MVYSSVELSKIYNPVPFFDAESRLTHFTVDAKNSERNDKFEKKHDEKIILEFDFSKIREKENSGSYIGQSVKMHDLFVFREHAHAVQTCD